MIELLNANALNVPLADRSVHCVVTSPPYYGLRDYGISGQLGLEQSPEEYVAKMVDVFREVKRVLRDDGTVWLNMGDSYAGSGKGQGGKGTTSEKQLTNFGSYHGEIVIDCGLAQKQLLGIPWRVAFALQADGWWLRSDIIWHKPNPMPESVTDRPTKSHEYVFLLTKSARYYYDADAVREEHQTKESRPDGIIRNREFGHDSKENKLRGFKVKNNIDQPQHSQHHGNDIGYSPNGRNRRTVWTIATAPYSGAHFATYPPKLVEPCIKAGTSEKGCCSICGAPWERVVEKGLTAHDGTVNSKYDPTKKQDGAGRLAQLRQAARERGGEYVNESKTIGWQPTCQCEGELVPCVVFDPFAGSGTTLLVARQLGRSGVGIDLSYAYLHEQAHKRLGLDKLRQWETNVASCS